jgi:DNA-directed RNA polymerase specialized sigma24 family protein
LNKITVYTVAHYRERAYHRREELTPDGFADIPTETPAPDERLICEQVRLKVTDVLYEIDADVRHVLIAHDINGVAMEEIAAQLRIALSTAYKWRARAMDQFVELWNQRRAADSKSVGPCGQEDQGRQCFGR